MISNLISQLIFHILIANAIGNVSIKILQINLFKSFTGSDKLNCDINLSNNYSDFINFIESSKPDIVLLISDCDSFIQKIGSLKSIDFLIIESKTIRNCTSDSNENDFKKTKLKFIIIPWHDGRSSSLQTLEWLSECLKMAEFQKKHVIIGGYNSPGSLEISNGSLNYPCEYNEKLLDLFIKYSKTIKGCLFGNANIDTFRIVLKKDTPMLPIFISPLSTNKHLRIYSYNLIRNELDNYVVYKTNNSGFWEQDYNCKETYGLINMKASSLYALVQSFMNTTNQSKFDLYLQYLLKSNPFKKQCKSESEIKKTDCIKCRSYCFIINLTKPKLDACLENCTLIISDFLEAEQNSGVLFVFVVIAGFVIILVGIVLAVNKVYCIRRDRHRNIFLAPLTLNIQAEVADDNQNSDLNCKLPNCKDEDDNSQIKNSNGFRRTNHDVEQTYNYIRM